DGVIHELELRHVAEIRDREHRLEYGLQAGIVTLAGQAVHLQEAFIGALLHFDQVRDLDGRGDFREIKTVAEGVVIVLVRHAKLLSTAVAVRPVARNPRAKKVLGSVENSGAAENRNRATTSAASHLAACARV